MRSSRSSRSIHRGLSHQPSCVPFSTSCGKWHYRKSHEASGVNRAELTTIPSARQENKHICHASFHEEVRTTQATTTKILREQSPLSPRIIPSNGRGGSQRGTRLGPWTEVADTSSSR